VRQLENVVKQAVILSSGGPVRPEHLAIERPADAPVSGGDVPPFHEAKARFERDYLQRLLAASGGNVVKAAQLSGIDRKEIYARVRRHDLDLDSYRGRLTPPERS
jgi:DNA-binding NtrC family response regulator